MISSEKNSGGPTSRPHRHDAPAVLVRQWLLLDVLVHVFDHHDRRIDHRADGDRDTAQRHDVGVDALQLHDDERDEHAERQAQKMTADERRWNRNTAQTSATTRNSSMSLPCSVSTARSIRSERS